MPQQKVYLDEQGNPQKTYLDEQGNPTAPPLSSDQFGTATSIRGVSPKEHYTRLIGEELPLVLGMMGGTAGLAAGGPFAPATAVAGAALGGGLGTAGKHVLYDVAGVPQPPATLRQSMTEMAKEAAGQGAQEMGAQVAGPLLKPTAEFLDRSAVKSLTRVLKPSGRGVEAAEKAVPKVLERRALRPSQALTYDMLGRTIDKRVAETGAEVGRVTARDVPAGATVDNTAIIDSLEKYKQSFMVPHQIGGQPLATGQTMGPSSETAEIANKTISKIQDRLREMGPSPSYKDMLKVKQQMDDLLGLAGHFTRDDEIAAQIEKRGADAVRHELYKPYPDVQRANAEMSMWKDMQAAFSGKMPEASPYERYRALRYAGEIGAAAGAAPYAGVGLSHGQGAEIGAAAVALEAMFRSTAWKVASANTKDALAKAIWNQDVPAMLRISTRVLQGGARAADVPPIEEPPPMPQRPTVTVEESHR